MAPAVCSLLQLPSLMWLKTCHFLKMTDMFELCKIDASFDRACKMVLTKHEVTVAFIIVPCLPHFEVLPSRTIQALQLFGQYIHRIRFVTGRFCLHPEILIEMIPILAESWFLKSVRVQVRKDEAFNYLTCLSAGEINWTGFLGNCIDGDKRRDIDVSVTVTFTDISDRDNCALFLACISYVPYSNPCQFVSKLTIDGTYLLAEEVVQGSPLFRSPPSSVFVSKFPALKKLVLPLDYITDVFLKELSVTNPVLTDLKVKDFKDDYDKPKDKNAPNKVLRQTWDSLTAALPGLKVTCCFCALDFDDLYTLLRNVFKPNAPITCVKFRDYNCDQMHDVLTRWCQKMDRAPNTVSVELVTEDRSCPQIFTCIMNDYFCTNNFNYRKYERKFDEDGACLHKFTFYSK